jgi:hypothetical protein
MGAQVVLHNGGDYPWANAHQICRFANVVADALPEMI